MMKKQWLAILAVGLSFGTSWAIRGQFGHEEGAAWAAAIGAMALVLVSRRKDWYASILKITLASALGWGAGGMISYGKVVGYGRSIDLGNAWYGILMLFVIGGLFGLLGGGLTGLALSSSGRKRVNWAALLTEMTAGGVIFYHLLVAQMEILMTPPRTEAWAVCLGAGAAMLWHMTRNDLMVPLRISLVTALGGGFGFAFGNFLQITGNILNIDFNMWNVMEYSIGFFGGTALAYSVFTSEWPEEAEEPETWENYSAWAIVFLFIPVAVLINSRAWEYLSSAAEMGTDNKITMAGSLSALAIVITVITLPLVKLAGPARLRDRESSMFLFLLFFAAYIFLSYIVTGAFSGSFHLNHHLYVVNYISIFLLHRLQLPVFTGGTRVLTRKAVLLGFAGIIVVTLLLAFILVNMHGEINGAASRFPNIITK